MYVHTYMYVYTGQERLFIKNVTIKTITMPTVWKTRIPTYVPQMDARGTPCAILTQIVGVFPTT